MHTKPPASARERVFLFVKGDKVMGHEATTDPSSFRLVTENYQPAAIEGSPQFYHAGQQYPWQQPSGEAYPLSPAEVKAANRAHDDAILFGERTSDIQAGIDRLAAQEPSVDELVTNYYNYNDGSRRHTVAPAHPFFDRTPPRVVGTPLPLRLPNLATPTYADIDVQIIQNQFVTPQTETLERVLSSLRRSETPPHSDFDGPYVGEIPPQAYYPEDHQQDAEQPEAIAPVQIAESSAVEQDTPEKRTEGIKAAARKALTSREGPSQELLERLKEGLIKLDDNPVEENPQPQMPMYQVKTLQALQGMPQGPITVPLPEDRRQVNTTPVRPEQLRPSMAKSTQQASRPATTFEDTPTLQLRTVEYAEAAVETRPKTVGRLIMSALGLKTRAKRDANHQPVRQTDEMGHTHSVREIYDAEDPNLVIDTYNVPFVAAAERQTIQGTAEAAERTRNAFAGMIGKIATRFTIGFSQNGKMRRLGRTA
jgi:hypothetical protein